MKIFGGEMITKVYNTIGMEENIPIEKSLVNPFKSEVKNDFQKDSKTSYALILSITFANSVSNLWISFLMAFFLVFNDLYSASLIFPVMYSS